MNNKTKALKTIEGMVLATEPKNKMLRACYRFAHAGLGECEHPAWLDELNRTYDRLKGEGVI